MRVHREQFQSGDLQSLQVLDHGRMGDAGIGTPQCRRNPRMQPGEPYDVGLVDHRLLPRDVWPVDSDVHRLDDQPQRHLAQGVHPDGGGCRHVVVGGVHPAGVRVEQDLGPVPVRAADAVSVALSGPHTRNEGVPDPVPAVLHRDVAFDAESVHQTEIDRFGAVGHHGEIGAAGRQGGAERERLAGEGAGSAGHRHRGVGGAGASRRLRRVEEHGADSPGSDRAAGPGGATPGPLQAGGRTQ